MTLFLDLLLKKFMKMIEKNMKRLKKSENLHGWMLQIVSTQKLLASNGLFLILHHGNEMISYLLRWIMIMVIGWIVMDTIYKHKELQLVGMSKFKIFLQWVIKRLNTTQTRHTTKKVSHLRSKTIM